MTKVGLHNEVPRMEWIKKNLEAMPPGLRILDAGAGEQLYRPLCSHLEYVSQDFGEYDGQGDGVGLQTSSWESKDVDIICDITRIPEPDASFDIILCTEVFEHLPDPLEAIREFSRLLKEGGLLILTAPFYSLVHFAPHHYYGGFSRYFHEKHLPSFGFDIREIEVNGNYFEFIAIELRRLPSIAERYTQSRTRKFERFAINVLLKMLERFSLGDNGSDEVLNFGYHIRAVKKAKK